MATSVDALLFLTRFSSPLPAGWQAQQTDRLSVSESARLARISRQLRREQFIVGHCLVRAALATAGFDVAAVEVAPDGGLVLVSPRSAHASIAHTGTAVAVVVARSPVGVDLETEQIRDQRAAAALLGVAYANDPAHVTRTWVVAEARLKARSHANTPAWVSGWDGCQLAVVGTATPPPAGVLDAMTGIYNAVALHWEAV